MLDRDTLYERPLSEEAAYEAHSGVAQGVVSDADLTGMHGDEASTRAHDGARAHDMARAHDEACARDGACRRGHGLRHGIVPHFKEVRKTWSMANAVPMHKRAGVGHAPVHASGLDPPPDLRALSQHQVRCNISL